MNSEGRHFLSGV